MPLRIQKVLVPSKPTGYTLRPRADGQQWNIVLSTPSRSRRAGFGDANVKVGDAVTAYGHRHADADTFEMKTERLKVSEELYDLYPNRT